MRCGICPAHWMTLHNIYVGLSFLSERCSSSIVLCALHTTAYMYSIGSVSDHGREKDTMYVVYFSDSTITLAPSSLSSGHKGLRMRLP